MSSTPSNLPPPAPSSRTIPRRRARQRKPKRRSVAMPFNSLLDSTSTDDTSHDQIQQQQAREAPVVTTTTSTDESYTTMELLSLVEEQTEDEHYMSSPTSAVAQHDTGDFYSQIHSDIQHLRGRVDEQLQQAMNAEGGQQDAEQQQEQRPPSPTTVIRRSAQRHSGVGLLRRDRLPSPPPTRLRTPPGSDDQEPLSVQHNPSSMAGDSLAGIASSGTASGARNAGLMTITSSSTTATSKDLRTTPSGVTVTAANLSWKQQQEYHRSRQEPQGDLLHHSQNQHMQSLDPVLLRRHARQTPLERQLLTSNSSMTTSMRGNHNKNHVSFAADDDNPFDDGGFDPTSTVQRPPPQRFSFDEEKVRKPTSDRNNDSITMVKEKEQAAEDSDDLSVQGLADPEEERQEASASFRGNDYAENDDDDDDDDDIDSSRGQAEPPNDDDVDSSRGQAEPSNARQRNTTAVGDYSTSQSSNGYRRKGGKSDKKKRSRRRRPVGTSGSSVQSSKTDDSRRCSPPPYGDSQGQKQSAITDSMRDTKRSPKKNETNADHPDPLMQYLLETAAATAAETDSIKERKQKGSFSTTASSESDVLWREDPPDPDAPVLKHHTKREARRPDPEVDSASSPKLPHGRGKQVRTGSSDRAGPSSSSSGMDLFFDPSISSLTSEMEDKAMASGKIEFVRLKALKDPYGDKGNYTGTLLQGKPHGKGTMRYDDGRCYSGQWKFARWHGNGRALFANGDLYVGQYDMDQRHGIGRYEWQDGRVYDGSFYHDQRHGTGTYAWPDGAVYSGDFKAGLRHGHGTYRFKDGSVYVGEWQSGRYHGVGECMWADGRCYRGEWEKGRAHGYGIETRPDGTVRHDGEWKKDRPIRKNKGS